MIYEAFLSPHALASKRGSRTALTSCVLEPPRGWVPMNVIRFCEQWWLSNADTIVENPHLSIEHLADDSLASDTLANDTGFSLNLWFRSISYGVNRGCAIGSVLAVKTSLSQRFTIANLHRSVGRLSTSIFSPVPELGSEQFQGVSPPSGHGFENDAVAGGGPHLVDSRRSVRRFS